MPSRSAYRSVKFTVALLLLVGAGFVGFVVAEHQMFPYGYVIHADRLLARIVKGELRPPASEPIVTTHLRLRLESLPVEGIADGSGGALASVGDELLLLSHDGQLFVLVDGAMSRMEIATPDNGRNEYFAVTESSRFEHLKHQPELLRYNDVLYYRNADSNGLVISYSAWLDERSCYRNVIAKLELPMGFSSIRTVNASGDDWLTLYESEPCLELKSIMWALEGPMAGGRLALRDPDTLILGNGDYGWDGVYAPEALPQLHGNDYGKVLAIDLEGGAVRTISSGHRNTQGVLVDAEGTLWVTEHGPRGGDELNRVVDDGDYGWPAATFGTRYNGLPWPGVDETARHAGYRLPVYSWVPSVGISNLIQISRFDPAWDGDLLAGSLRERMLYRLHLEAGRVLFVEPIKIGRRIRYAHQHSDETLYLWTDTHELLTLYIDDASPADVFIEEFLSEAPHTDSEIQRLRSAIEGCQECHSFEAGVHERAPSLGNVFGRRIAGTSFQYYSPAMRRQSGKWTATALERYIRNPGAMVPGTTMPDPDVGDDTTIEGIVELLVRLTREPE